MCIRDSDYSYLIEVDIWEYAHHCATDADGNRLHHELKYDTKHSIIAPQIINPWFIKAIIQREMDMTLYERDVEIDAAVLDGTMNWGHWFSISYKCNVLTGNQMCRF